MSGKRLNLSVKAPARIADAWVEKGSRLAGLEEPPRAQVHTARLTLDITPALRKSLKLAAIKRGITVAELLRNLLEREFSTTTEEQP
jgi:hypothetical protein